MRAYRKLTAMALVLCLLLFLAANGLALHLDTKNEKAYRVEISRAAHEIAEKGLESLDLSQFPRLIRVTSGEGAEFLKGGEEAYAIREIEGKLYRFDYDTGNNTGTSLLRILNGCLGAAFLLLFGVLLYVKREIISPFERVSHLPEELAKGNLTMPALQHKNRYLGNFLWGMDLLREKLEHQKTEQLKLQKEKKSLILSLAHDLKTPLSAIKLYSQALSRNLYREPERQQEIFGKIGQKVEEMEGYLGKIMEASQEDFLHLEVRNGEFYLSELRNRISSYYEDKLRLLKLPCTMDFGENCLLKGDPDRCEEILQNVMENAIKYGSGGEITVSASEEGNCRIIKVANQHCSLPEEELPHIFDSFWRGSNGESIPGSGLGLYICRQLARAMGGDIFAEIRKGEMEVSLVILKA